MEYEGQNWIYIWFRKGTKLSKCLAVTSSNRGDFGVTRHRFTVSVPHTCISQTAGCEGQVVHRFSVSNDHDRPGHPGSPTSWGGQQVLSGERHRLTWRATQLMSPLHTATQYQLLKQMILYKNWPMLFPGLSSKGVDWISWSSVSDLEWRLSRNQILGLKLYTTTPTYKKQIIVKLKKKKFKIYQHFNLLFSLWEWNVPVSLGAQ